MAFTETRQVRYVLLRDTLAAASVDTDLTATQKTWAHFVTNYSTDSCRDVTGNPGKSWKVPLGANAALVTFDFNDNAGTATFILYAYRERGPAEFICTSTLIAGAQTTDDSTARYYADTVGTVTQRWLQTVYKVDAAGNDGVAKMAFDLSGADRLLCLFTVIKAADDVRARVAYI